MGEKVKSSSLRGLLPDPKLDPKWNLLGKVPTSKSPFDFERTLSGCIFLSNVQHGHVSLVVPKLLLNSMALGRSHSVLCGEPSVTQSFGLDGDPMRVQDSRKDWKSKSNFFF